MSSLCEIYRDQLILSEHFTGLAFKLNRMTGKHSETIIAMIHVNQKSHFISALVTNINTIIMCSIKLGLSQTDGNISFSNYKALYFSFTPMFEAGRSELWTLPISWLCTYNTEILVFP